MTVIAPMMKTEKNSAILVQNLMESRIPGMIIGGVQQGPIPLRADLHIRNPDTWPRSFHSDAFIGLTKRSSAAASESARGCMVDGLITLNLRIGAGRGSLHRMVRCTPIMLFRERRPGLTKNITPAGWRTYIRIAEPQLEVNRAALGFGALQP